MLFRAFLSIFFLTSSMLEAKNVPVPVAGSKSLTSGVISPSLSPKFSLKRALLSL